MDNKLKEVEVMVSLFESKLNSLPSDITSKYPELQNYQLNDFSGLLQFQKDNNIQQVQNNGNENSNQINNNNNNNNNNNSNSDQNNNQNISNINDRNQIPLENNEAPNNIPEEVIKEEPAPETPYEKLQFLIKNNPDFELERLEKMLKLQIPSMAVLQKASMMGISKVLAAELIDLYKQVNPNCV